MIIFDNMIGVIIIKIKFNTFGNFLGILDEISNLHILIKFMIQKFIGFGLHCDVEIDIWKIILNFR